MKTQIFERAIVSAGIVALLALLLPSAAWAQDKPWYVAGGLGVTFIDDVTDDTGTDLTTDTGFMLTGAVGRHFGQWRAEGELLYAKADADTVEGLGLSFSANGDVSATAGMLNGYYDFDTGSKWIPYVGLGVGYANVGVNDLSAMGMAGVDDSDNVIAAQAKLGVGYMFSDALTGTFGYRFFGTDDLSLTDAAGTFDADGIVSHTLEAGLRFNF